uniref:muramidase n=1 Tax=uncultured Sphingomonas sp. TaxID=158754 RepID=UPI0035CB5515
MSPAPAAYAITVHTGATLRQEPVNAADAEATVRDLIALGADFNAGPLNISGRDFVTYGVTSGSVFDACALARSDDGQNPGAPSSAPSVSSVAALVRRAFGARVTDTIRPMNASYGARYSWHKYGQAVDFVPAGGVNSIDRAQIRALMDQSGIRLIELLGPGDRGHSNHWHVAFARPGQVIDRARPIEGDEDWIVNVAQTDVPSSTRPIDPEVSRAPASALASAVKAPPQWDVFASNEWRAAHGGGS